MQIAAIVISLAVTAVTIPLTVVAVRKMLAVIRTGTGSQALGRTNDPAARTVNMLKETFLHTRMLQWTWVGALHWFAYAAFLFLSSAVAQAFFQLFDADFVWPVIGHFFLYEWVGEFLGLMGALAIIPLIVYRQVIHPRRLGRKSRFFGSNFSQAYFVEFMVLLESSAILFIRGAEYNLYLARGGEEAEKYANGFHFPIAQYFGNLYPTGADSIGTLENIIYVIATIKIVSAMAWLIVIATNLTMGVAWHRFTAWFNIWFKRESSGGTALGGLQPIRLNGKSLDMEALEDLEEEDFEKLGVGKVEDFSWKGILDFTTCTECGRCQSQCPAWNTEKPLSPKLLMMGLREHAYAKAAIAGKDADTLTEDEQKELERPLIGDESMYGVIDPDVLWSCTNCGACVQQCPVDIEHVDHIDDMRRFQVLVESNFPAELNNIFKGLERKGNPWGINPKDRMDWAKNLDFPVKQVGVDVESLDEVEWLFWVGCAGAFEDRAKKTTAAVAELLNTAGVEFAVLGEGETCTGDSARRAGNEIVFMQLAMENAEVFKETKVKKVVSTCAHCFNTLKNEYAEFGVELEVVHHTQLLNRLVREGKLKPVAPGAGAESKSITYHDPCFLGRHNQVYEPPRELLQVIPGATFTEMPRNSETSFCCGAGGARMWMEEKLGTQINVNRTDEAIATGADQIAVGCPFCRVMLSDGLTKRQSEGAAREEVEVLDVAQMLLAAVKRAPEPTAEETEAVVEEATAATAAAVEAEPTEAEKADESSVSETDEVGAAADAHKDDHSDNETPDDAETAAEHDIDIDDDGKGHSLEGGAKAAQGEPESAEKQSDDQPTDDREASEKEDAAWANVGPVNTDLTPSEPGDTDEPETESVPDDSDDEPEIEPTKETEGAPAEEVTDVPDENEPVQDDAREEEAEATEAKADDQPSDDQPSDDQPTDDREASEKEKAAWANVGPVNTDLTPSEPGDTDEPETESVPDDSDDEPEIEPTKETEGAPAEEVTDVPDENEPVQDDAREEEAEATEAKADDQPTDDREASEKEKAAWANVGPVNTDLLPDSPATGETEKDEDPGDTEEPETESVPQESDDEPEIAPSKETDGSPAEELSDGDGGDDSHDEARDEEAAQTGTGTITPVDEAPTEEPATDVAELSDANPSGEELSETATEIVPDVEHHAQETDEDALEEWVEEGGKPAPKDDETKP